MNYNKNVSHQTLWSTANNALERQIYTLTANIGKHKRFKINDLSSHHKKLEKIKLRKINLTKQREENDKEKYRRQ